MSEFKPRIFGLKYQRFINNAGQIWWTQLIRQYFNNDI